MIMSQVKLYQSVLRKLSDTPTEYLPQVDSFLSELHREVQNRNDNRQEILALAGSWKGMSDEDFQDYRRRTAAVTSIQQPTDTGCPSS